MNKHTVTAKTMTIYTNSPPSTPEARKRWDAILDIITHGDRPYSIKELAGITNSKYNNVLRILKIMEANGIVKCVRQKIEGSHSVNTYTLAEGNPTYGQRDRKLNYRKMDDPLEDPKYGEARKAVFHQLRRKGIGKGRALMESFRRYPNN